MFAIIENLLRPALLATLLMPASAALAQEAEGTWDTLAPLPEGRTEVSVAGDGEVLYLAGGFSGFETAPREVYANGFQPNGKELEANRFSGKAVAFLPVARFETN